MTETPFSQKDTKIYRPCVGIALFNQQGHVFVGERIDSPGAWQMPQGGIDKGESIETAIYRELKEETGIDESSAHILEVASQTIRYDLPAHLQNKLWNGVFAGQEQTWAALRFSGDDAEIDIEEQEIDGQTVPAEFNNWKWVPLEKTIDLIVPFKRGVYQQVIALFSGTTTTSQ